MRIKITPIIELIDQIKIITQINATPTTGSITTAETVKGKSKGVINGTF